MGLVSNSIFLRGAIPSLKFKIDRLQQCSLGFVDKLVEVAIKNGFCRNELGFGPQSAFQLSTAPNAKIPISVFGRMKNEFQKFGSRRVLGIRVLFDFFDSVEPGGTTALFVLE